MGQREFAALIDNHPWAFMENQDSVLEPHGAGQLDFIYSWQEDIGH
jgi:hypothetical protein